jgi:WD40 repeat protein
MGDPIGRKMVIIILSQQNMDALERLQAELQPSSLGDLIPVWADSLPQSDEDWKDIITRLFDDARLVILFISESFQSSPGMEEGLPRILTTAKECSLPVLPVFLTSTRFRRPLLDQLRLFNDPTRPLSVNPPEDRDLIWLQLGERVQDAWEEQLPEAPVRALLLTLHGPTAEVLGLAWSPDGRWVAAASADSHVYLWEAATGHLSHYLQDHRSEVQSIAWSPDGSRLASASIDGTACVWDATTGQHLLTYTGHANEVRSIAWSPDSIRIASASYDRTVQVWDAATGQRLLTYAGHADGVNAVAWSPDSLRIASGGGEFFNWKSVSDTSVQVWSATTKQRLLTYAGHDAGVHTIAWSPNGRHIASGGVDQTVQVWDTVTGERHHTWKGNFSEVCAVVWSPDGKRLAAAYADGPVRVWEMATGKHLCAYQSHARYGALAVAWSPDGSRIASEGPNQTVQVWQAP